MFEFDSSKGHAGAATAIGNHTTGDYAVDGWIANFEAYDIVHMCGDFIRVRMEFLSDQYSVKDSPYGHLEAEAWEFIESEYGISPREKCP